MLLFATLAIGSLSPAGDAVRSEIRAIQDEQYERGRRTACTIGTVNGVTSQDDTGFRAVERRCARYATDTPPHSRTPPRG
jgi:hypothetical protein